MGLILGTGRQYVAKLASKLIGGCRDSEVTER